MALNTKPKAMARPRLVEDDDEDARFERAISGGSDYRGEGAPAPVAAEPAEKPRRKRKKPITFTVDEDMIERFDKLARRRGMSRAAVMILAFSEHLERNDP